MRLRTMTVEGRRYAKSFGVWMSSSSECCIMRCQNRASTSLVWHKILVPGAQSLEEASDDSQRGWNSCTTYPCFLNGVPKEAFDWRQVFKVIPLRTVYRTAQKYLTQRSLDCVRFRNHVHTHLVFSPTQTVFKNPPFTTSKCTAFELFHGFSMRSWKRPKHFINFWFLAVRYLVYRTDQMLRHQKQYVTSCKL